MPCSNLYHFKASIFIDEGLRLYEWPRTILALWTVAHQFHRGVLWFGVLCNGVVFTWPCAVCDGIVVCDKLRLDREYWSTLTTAYVSVWVFPTFSLKKKRPFFFKCVRDCSLIFCSWWSCLPQAKTCCDAQFSFLPALSYFVDKLWNYIF